MMINRAFITLCFLVFSSFSSADTLTGVNIDMTSIGHIMQRLYPQLINEDTAYDEETLASIRTDLASLRQHFRHVNAMNPRHSEAFRLSLENALEYLDRTESLLANGYPLQGLNLARGISYLCVECHTKDDEKQIFTLGSLSMDLKDPMLNAEFQFMTRNYGAALDNYKQVLAAQKKIRYTSKTVDALERILVIYLQVYRNPEEAIDYFDSLLQKDMTKQVRLDLEQWVSGLRIIIDKQLLAYDADYETLKGYADAFIAKDAAETLLPDSGQRKVLYVWLRALIHEYLENQPSNEHTPMVLYWLSLVDRALDYGFYVSLSELYLKQCIVGYPETEAAKLCFDEYKHYMEFIYSGSAGLQMPEEIANELAEMAQLIQKAQKH